MRTHGVLAVLLALVASWSTARAGVIVIDPGGNGDFETAQAAIDAAAEGDTLLISPTSCFSCIEVYTVIDGKSLTIVWDPGPTVPPGSVHIFQTLLIRNLQPDQLVVLRGVSVQPQIGLFISNDGAMVLQDNAGAVWLEDCDVLGARGDGAAPSGCAAYADVPGRPAIGATNCETVVVVNSTLTGGPGKNAFDPFPLHNGSIATDGGPAVRATGSNVAVYASTVTGGQGGAGQLCTEHADGGVAITAAASMVLVSGCTVTGGIPGGPPAGAPGNGVHGDASASFELIGTSVVVNPAAIAFDTAPGTVFTYPGPARTFLVTSPVREGQAGTFQIQGAQGDFVGFFWAFNGGSLPMPGRNGWFLLAPPIIAGPFLLGAITAPSGIWDIAFTGPNLPPAAESQTFLLQAYFAYPGGVTLSSGTAFTLVDQAL